REAQTKGAWKRGGSTITQQLAKNLYLSPKRSMVRKAKEALYTVALEHFLTKDRILEIYLNVIEWGPGIYGAQAASRHYFGVDASQLSLDQAARLAAVLPKPLKVRPDRDSRFVNFRKAAILQNLRNFKGIGDVHKVEPDDDQEDVPDMEETGPQPAKDSTATDPRVDTASRSEIPTDTSAVSP
ncbi:MAG TPA: transglycosylase domain-containing protein, partial [Fibrobacteria bacterium]|nr:transglycosylase domain-containing protein [Fibrobacteria bacterium]